MSDPPSPRVIVGWNEYVELPDWGIRRLRVKVDTGARTSALHVEDLEELPDGDVLFHVVLSRRHPDRRIPIRGKVVRCARVRSSTGVYSTRFFVRTRIRLGPVEKEIEVSLVSRGKMLFRMLLGRKALEPEFLVDPGRKKVFAEGTRRRRRESPS